MKRFKCEDVFVSDEEYKALKTAAKRKDRIIYSPPESLDTSSGLCFLSDMEPDNLGGLKPTYKTHLIISDNGLRYVKWRRKKHALEAWHKIKRFFIFWIPTGISIVALIVAIISLCLQKQSTM